MKSRNVVRIFAIAGATGMLAFLVAADKGPRRQATEVFMRGKMVCSQLILEGLVLEQYDVVSRNTIRLHEMTQSNLWYTSRQPDYMTKTTNFQQSVQSLYMAAVDRNLDNATEAYASMAKNCVDCHRLTRTDQFKRSQLTQAK